MECLWLIFGFAIVIITYGLFISLVTISISTFSALKRPIRNTLLGAPRSSARLPFFLLYHGVYQHQRWTIIDPIEQVWSIVVFTIMMSFVRLHIQVSNLKPVETSLGQVNFLWFLLFRFGKSVFSKIQVFHLLLDRYQRLGWTRYFHQAVFVYLVCFAYYVRLNISFRILLVSISLLPLKYVTVFICYLFDRMDHSGLISNRTVLRASADQYNPGNEMIIDRDDNPD